MDTAIILNSFISFTLFLLAHAVVFRLIDEKTVIKWLVNVFCLIGIVNIISGILLMFPFYPVLGVLVSFIIYTCLVFCYILGFFGLIESSIRIRLLTEIYQSGQKGISERDILKVYNREVIVRKRLERFIASGELKYNKGYYRLNKKFSYFYINDWITERMRKLYRWRI